MIRREIKEPTGWLAYVAIRGHRPALHVSSPASAAPDAENIRAVTTIAPPSAQITLTPIVEEQFRAGDFDVNQ